MVSVNFLIAVVAAILTAVSALPTAVAATSSNDLIIHAGTIIRDNYIVLMKENMTDSDFKEHQIWAASQHDRQLNRRDEKGMASIKYNYNVGTLKGYSGVFDAALIEEVNSPDYSPFTPAM